MMVLVGRMHGSYLLVTPLYSLYTRANDRTIVTLDRLEI